MRSFASLTFFAPTSTDREPMTLRIPIFSRSGSSKIGCSLGSPRPSPVFRSSARDLCMSSMLAHTIGVSGPSWISFIRLRWKQRTWFLRYSCVDCSTSISV